MPIDAPGSVCGGQGADSAQIGRETDVALAMALIQTLSTQPGTELVRKGFIYVALMNAMSSLTTMPGPIGTSRGFAISSFLNSILPFHTLRKKSSKT